VAGDEASNSWVMSGRPHPHDQQARGPARSGLVRDVVVSPESMNPGPWRSCAKGISAGVYVDTAQAFGGSLGGGHLGFRLLRSLEAMPDGACRGWTRGTSRSSFFSFFLVEPECSAS